MNYTCMTHRMQNGCQEDLEPLHFIRSRLVLSSFGTLLEEGTDGEVNAQIE